MAKEMELIRKALRYLASLEFFIALAICASLWSVLGAYYLKLSPADMMDTVPVKAFLAMILLNRLAGLYSEVRKKSLAAILSAGVLLALIGVGLFYATGFKGIVGLGEGEPMEDYAWSSKGILGSEPELDITVDGIDASPLSLDDNAAVVFRVNNGEPVTLRPGGSEDVGSGIVVKVLDVGAAPAFRIRKKTGQTIVSGIVKLKLYPKGEQDYFITEVLPHRFYLTLVENEEAPLGLKAVRAKLVLVNRDVALGEDVPVDDFIIVFDKFENWAVLEVSRAPSLMVIYLGAVIALLGGAIAVISSRGRR